MSVYQVAGRVAYRGHPPGTVFETVLPAAAEERAIRRGSITLVEQSRPALKEGSFRLPKPSVKKEAP